MKYGNETKKTYTHKNCNEKLERSSKVFTLIGLVLALFIVYICIEHETKKVEFQLLQTANLDATEPYTTAMLFRKEVPKEMIEKAPAKAYKEVKKVILELAVPVPDIIELPEILETSEPTDVYIDSITEVSIPETVFEDVPFEFVEEAPVFPGCVGDSKELKKCLSKNIKKHVNRKFNAGLGQELGLTAGKKKIFVIFKIDAKGAVSDIQARAPHARLKKEAERVIRLLPKMKPGRQGDRAVGVQYTIPISFEVQE